MNRSVLWLMICLTCVTVRGQQTGVNADSLARRLQADSAHIYRKTLAKPYLRVENRNSFIHRDPVDFYGGLAGATFFDRHTVAVGYYVLENSSRRAIRHGKVPGATLQLLRLAHFSFVYQYVLLNTRFLQLNIPLEVGAGSYYARTTDSARALPTHRSGLFLPLGGAIQAIGKVYRWLGVSASGGFRYVNNADLLFRYNGPYYSFGLWIDARQLWRDTRYRHAKKKYRRLMMQER